MILTAVTFTRKKDSKLEVGILINEGSGGILDANGDMVVGEVYDYRRHDCLFQIHLGPILTFLQEELLCMNKKIVN